MNWRVGGIAGINVRRSYLTFQRKIKRRFDWRMRMKFVRVGSRKRACLAFLGIVF
jgi:hypothetical protein